MVRRVIRGYIIGGVVLSFVGSYLVASGINQLAVGPTGGSIFAPVFAGLMLILGAFCLLLNSEYILRFLIVTFVLQSVRVSGKATSL